MPQVLVLAEAVPQVLVLAEAVPQVLVLAEAVPQVLVLAEVVPQVLVLAEAEVVPSFPVGFAWFRSRGAQSGCRWGQTRPVVFLRPKSADPVGAQFAE